MCNVYNVYTVYIEYDVRYSVMNWNMQSSNYTPQKYDHDFLYKSYIVSARVDKMRAELPNLNHCAVPFLNRAPANLSWYDNLCWCYYRIYNSYFEQ